MYEHRTGHSMGSSWWAKPLFSYCLHSLRELQQVARGSVNIAVSDTEGNERRASVCPLERQADVPAARMLHLEIPPTVLATERTDDWQMHASERMNRQGDGHAFRKGRRVCCSLRCPSGEGGG